MLGFALHKLGRFDESDTAYEAAMRAHPRDGEVIANHAGILQDRAQHGKALRLIERLCELRPEHAIPWIMKSRCLYQMWKHKEGLEAANAALGRATRPEEHADALNQRAIQRRELGETRQAIEDCETLIRLRPDHAGLRTNHLLFLLSDIGLTADRLSAVAREHGAAIETAAVARSEPFGRIPTAAGSRLRIGFLSPDFRVHSVMHFVEPLLARLDRREFEVWSLYLLHQEDTVTQRARQLSDHFVSLAGMDHDASIRTLRALELDVVIDLAGHSGSNGLPLLAARVAPVQVSWLGYPATTGIQAIDYKFTDHVTDPEGAQVWYSEKLHRMDGFFCCYRPMIRSPLLRYHNDYEVKPAPVLRHGHVTFGSCNNLSKLTDEVLRLWGRILDRTPGARLLVEGKDLDNAEFGAIFRDKCARAGIDPDRLELVGLDPKNQYLTYHRIDIALDPFPLTGGTTSCDALWMGVPLVSLEGEMFSGRMSTGVLTFIGHPEWIARDADTYVAIACELASNHDRLNAIRMTLRPAMENSPVMDEAFFAQQFGQGLRQAWHEALGSHGARTQPPALEASPSDPPSPHGPHVAAASPGADIQVANAKGQRISIGEAYDELQQRLSHAKAAPSTELLPADLGLQPVWREVTDSAKLLLANLPGDPMALAVLAEVELAHGNEPAASHYMNWAVSKLAATQALR